MESRCYWVYILACNSRRLYIGVTGDIDRRMIEHKSKQLKGFTSRYNLDQLVYYEAFGEIDEAIAREKFLKRQRRSYKLKLIEGKNPEWQDFAARLGEPTDLNINGIG